MKVYEEISLKDFDFWNYAVVVVDNMSDGDFDAVEQWMEETGDTWSKTDVNDLFAFNYKTIEAIIGRKLIDDDEPEDIDSDCGYDAYEGYFTYDV